ncbi:hypothetical protein MMC30_001742 [Trapelia coarctata]|nr:hypothetical protein [Trapelia coarctata]
MEASSGALDETQASKAEDEPVQCKSFATMILDAPPSCIEFSRVAEEIFVVGTYSLVEAEDTGGSQSRNGSLVLMRGAESGLTSLQTHATGSAVLDLHFSPYQPKVLAVATSTGAVEIFQLRLDNRGRLERFKSIQIFEPTVLVLSVAWHPSPLRLTTLAVSLSNGNLAVIDYAKPTAIIRVLEAHSLEAWTVAWSPEVSFEDPYDGFSLYSGGDDSGFCNFPAINTAHDHQESEDADGAPEPGTLNAGFDSKIHSAGLTAILPFYAQVNDQIQLVLLTGSYDERVRLLKQGPNGRWKSVKERRLGGGVWRLKMISGGHEFVRDGKCEWVYHVLASCMHAGARVLQIRLSDFESWSIRVLAKFEEHESMNYGGDATFAIENDDPQSRSLVIASTSFYDRKLCLWTFPLRQNSETRFEIGRIEEEANSSCSEEWSLPN